MENNRKFELNDEALDNVAGGRDGFHGAGRHRIRNNDYACSNCGGHEFFIVDGTTHHYSGECVNCGTYNSRVSHTGDNVEIFFA